MTEGVRRPRVAQSVLHHCCHHWKEEELQMTVTMSGVSEAWPSLVFCVYSQIQINIINLGRSPNLSRSSTDGKAASTT